MSQGDLKETGGPWDWSDQTIVSLMNELQKIRDIIEKYPNDMELGKHIRQWYWDREDSK